MSATTADGFNGVQSDSAAKILDAIQKGFTTMADVIDFCGPDLIDERRAETGSTDAEMDVPAALRTIDRLIEEGYIARRSQRYAKQLKLELTDAGREAAPEQSELERQLQETHEISEEAFRVLINAADYYDRNGKTPTMEKIVAEYDMDMLAHQVSVLYNQLAEADVAKIKGFFRFRIVPTDEGRALIEEYGDQV